MHRYVKLTEVVAHLQVSNEFLNALEDENLIHLKRSSEGEVLMSTEDVERVRLALVLTSELDVNLAGVEVIMHMRESMLAMHRQFAEVLDALVAAMRRQPQR